MKKLFFLSTIIISLFFFSCKSEITLTAQKDGSVLVSYNGDCGKYFETMLRTFSEAENGPLFDLSAIKSTFYTNGFKNVTVTAPTNTGLKTEMIAPENSFLFTSGLLVCDKNDCFVFFSPEILNKFYDSADSEILEILDLFLAPVFNKEIMSEEEYLNTISTFYGDEASKEIGECKIKLSIISAKNEKKIFYIPLTKIMTLNETLKF